MERGRANRGERVIREAWVEKMFEKGQTRIYFINVETNSVNTQYKEENGHISLSDSGAHKIVLSLNKLTKKCWITSAVTR